MIELRNISKTYTDGETSVEAVRDVNLTIGDGEIFGIIGLSGAGKSTLVRCINYLERPTSGEVVVDGVALGSLSRRQLLVKRREMSMIFQGFNLLEQRTALRNVCYPLEIAGVNRAAAKEKALELLSLVGLSDKAGAYPAQLSGGQQQRVAIARALASDPRVLLCDEATSALDPNTTRSILELLQSINRTLGVTIIVITHEMRVIEQICSRVAVMDSSQVVETGPVRDVFLSPKSSTAKDLILPKSGTVESMNGRRGLRLIFDGQSAFEPIISNLTMECNTPVNILIANTKSIEGRAYGQMILQLPGDSASVAMITDYLDKRHVHWEEVDKILFWHCCFKTLCQYA